ncbi:mitochondrial import inner membrane translocase subunit TIM44-like [Anopheles bellator]|uniref:mitochondrial import inner membrane translocase subunit TIM44-like n=1 Tax=Anopheles bellator TaxID=139047 RepID=UPI00264A3F8A|nr:mitochondrial import inner membrane translocase subunit TIM44-like [Anopheles bellator]
MQRILLLATDRALPSAAGRYPLRAYSGGRAPSFFSRVIANIRQELEKSNEMKENVKKFRQDAHRLEQSDTLQAARKKFRTVESEASRGRVALKENLAALRGRLMEAVDEASRTKVAHKAGQLSESLAEQGHKLGQSGAFRTISKTAKVVRQEMESHEGMAARVYRSPVKLRKRIEMANDPSGERTVKPNATATGIEIHKDSKLYQSWESFKTNSQVVNQFLTWKIHYDESEQPMIRAFRLLTDKVGALFSRNELSEALSEICRIDPSFDQRQFLLDCENDIIPNVLESIIRGELEVLRDWCFQSTYNTIAAPIEAAIEAGYRLDSKLLDIESVDLVMGKMMPQGPVLIVSFQTQQVACVRNAQGSIVEGDPEKVLRCNHVWVLCRDTNEPNPRSAWRLMEISTNYRTQLV